MVPGVVWQETSPLFKGLPVCEIERAMLPCSSPFAMHLEILEYLALDMLYYLLPHLLCLKLAAWQGELFQTCAVQKTAWQEDSQVTSRRSVPSPAPLLSNPLEMMKLGLSILGLAGNPKSGTGSQLLAACCQLRGLLTAITLDVPCKTPLPQPLLQRNHTPHPTLPIPPTPRDQQGDWVTLGSLREVSPSAIFAIQENILVSSSLPSPSPYGSGDGDDFRTPLFPYCPTAGPAGGVGAKGGKV